jgi:dTMP kinase
MVIVTDLHGKDYSLPDFIIIEGVNGSGKTSLVNKLREYLNRKLRMDVHFCRTDCSDLVNDPITPVIQSVKNVLESNSSLATKEAYRLYFTMTHSARLMELYKNFFAFRVPVICERSWVSTQVYQPIDGISNRKAYSDYCKLSNQGTTHINAKYVLLDVSPRIAFDRVNSRDNQPRGMSELDFANYQKLEHHADAFYKIFTDATVSDENWSIINTNSSIDEVFEKFISTMLTPL